MADRIRIWTKDRVAEEAKRFETRTAFQRGTASAYRIAHRKGWLDDVCTHMRRQGDRISRHVYAIEDRNCRLVYVGLAANVTRRYAQHRSAPRPDMVEFMAGTHELIVLTVHPLKAENAARLEHDTIERYRRDGWTVLNRAKAGGLGGRFDAYWTVERLTAEAIRCGSRRAMKEHSGAAYVIASRQGLIEAIFASVPNGGLNRARNPNGSWSKERLTALAVKCGTRQVMAKRHAGAYLAAHRKGLLPAIFAGVPNNGYLRETSPKRQYLK